MKQYRYDVALSFSGEDRSLVRRLAKQLKSMGLEVFFDEYKKWELLGEDLVLKLREVYTKQAKFFVPVISYDYVNKQYPRFEFKAAIRAAFLRDETYILPLRLDNTPFDLLDETVSYIDLTMTELKDVVKIITEKVYSSEPLEEIVDINERIMEFLSFIAVRYRDLLSPGSKTIELSYLQEYMKQFKNCIARFAPVINSAFYIRILNYVDFCSSKLDIILNHEAYNDEEFASAMKDFGYDKLNSYMFYLELVEMHDYLSERNYSENIDLIGFGEDEDFDFLSRGAKTIRELFSLMKQDFEKNISGKDYRNWFVRLCVFEANIIFKPINDDMIEEMVKMPELAPLFSAFDEIISDFKNSSIYDESTYKTMRDMVGNPDDFFKDSNDIGVDFSGEMYNKLSEELIIARDFYKKRKNVIKYKRIITAFINIISTRNEIEIISFISKNKIGLQRIAIDLKLLNLSFIVKNAK